MSAGRPRSTTACRKICSPRSPCGKRDYFAFLGRISPEKGIERAIQIAGRCGVKLKVAAKVDKADAEYFKHSVEPLLADANVEFIGEINDAQNPLSSPARRRCCSRSTGRSLLAW